MMKTRLLCFGILSGIVVACGHAPAKAPTVVALEEAPRAMSPPKTARIHHLARGNNAYVGRLELEAGAKVPVHRDPTEEFIHVLEGGGQMTIDGRSYEVKPGVTIYMPAEAEVSFENGPQRTVVIQVFAGPGPAEKYRAWPADESQLAP